ncbi:MAG: NAD(P)-dependent oxidoreductase [Verrucomicrobia bacterium]|nr:NAD(P)-dependent oxidoreductase [Verrucomicrobiota bacterium]
MSAQDDRSIGFIGLGNMGSPIAANLLKAGYRLRVYNRTREKADPLVEQGAIPVSRSCEAAAENGIVFTMVADDAGLEQIALADPAFTERLKGGVHVSLSTISPETARRLDEHHRERGVIYLSSPVIGRPDRAAAAALFILLAGPSPAKTTVEPLLRRIGQRIFDLGEQPWLSNAAKLAVNFNILAAVECMAESFTLAEKHGIAREKMAELLSETLFGGVVYKGYGEYVARHRYEPAGFRVKLGWKDLRLVLDLAAEGEVPMPVGSLLRDRLLAALAKGRADMDWSAIALGCSEDAGLAGSRT